MISLYVFSLGHGCLIITLDLQILVLVDTVFSKSEHGHGLVWQETNLSLWLVLHSPCLVKKPLWEAGVLWQSPHTLCMTVFIFIPKRDSSSIERRVWVLLRFLFLVQYSHQAPRGLCWRETFLNLEYMCVLQFTHSPCPGEAEGTESPGCCKPAKHCTRLSPGAIQ